MHAPLRYKGYEVAPSAQQLPNGLYAANLTIGPLPSDHHADSGANSRADSRADNGAGTRRVARHSFDALDYFFDERHALAYACRWARMWIDEQRRCA